MTGPNGHAPFSTWARDKLRALVSTLRHFGLLNWLLLLGTIAAAAQAYFEFKAISNPRAWDFAVMIAKGLVALIPGFVLILSKRNSDNYAMGLVKGRVDTTREWQMAVQGQFNALKELAEMLDQTTTKQNRLLHGRGAVQAAMLSTQKIVVSIFDDIDETRLTVSLGVPNAARTQMKIVELLPATGKRQEGNVYDVDPDPAKQHSMIRSFVSGVPSNTPDAHRHADLASKSYRSILSFPIKDGKNQQIAALNIDGPNVGMFGDSMGIGSDTSFSATAFDLAQPNLKALAIALSQGELYKEYRQS